MSQLFDRLGKRQVGIALCSCGNKHTQTPFARQVNGEILGTLPNSQVVTYGDWGNFSTPVLHMVHLGGWISLKLISNYRTNTARIYRHRTLN